MPTAYSKAVFVNAVKNNKVRVFQKILSDVDIVNNMYNIIFKKEWGPCTTLMYAAWSGSTDVVRLLLHPLLQQYKGNTVNFSTISHGITALHCAAFRGRIDTVRVLLDANANINKGSNDGLTPINWAAVNGKTDTVFLLCEAHADVNKVDNDGNTPLHSAAEHGHVDTVCVLLEAHADVNKANNDGDTPLHWAADRGHTSIVKHLLQQGADVTKVDSDNKTALQKAKANGHYKTVQAIHNYVRKNQSATKDTTKEVKESDLQTAQPSNVNSSFLAVPTTVYVNRDRSLLLLPEHDELPSCSTGQHVSKATGVPYRIITDPKQKRKLPTEHQQVPPIKKIRKIQGRPTEKELGSLTQFIGFEWILLAAELDISRCVTQQIEMTYTDAKTRIFEMLVQWRANVQDKSEEERIETLKQALKADHIGKTDIANMIN